MYEFIFYYFSFLPNYHSNKFKDKRNFLTVKCALCVCVQSYVKVHLPMCIYGDQRPMLICMSMYTNPQTHAYKDLHLTHQLSSLSS